MTLVMYTCVGLLLLIALTHGQPECQAPVTPLLTNNHLLGFQNCQLINGSLILGYRDCTQSCTITDFSSLSNLNTITDSFVIQCCNTLTTIPPLPRLTSVQGTFRVYYNSGLRSLSTGLILATVGNIEIAQNAALTSIDGLQHLAIIKGYISISYNPSLTSITGLTSLVTIRGSELVSGHALKILYNVALTDITGLKELRTIEYGAVHIEGNTQLCYAGYPKWNYGSYGSRYSTGDKGIDWRSILTVTWQFTWGSNGVPMLIIRDNGDETTCASASCHSSCTTGAGCLGPNEADLCGRCYQTNTINSCNEVNSPGSEQQTCYTLWPPTQLPFSAIFGLLVGLGGILILIIVIAILVVGCRLHKRFSDEKGGSYNVHSNVESGYVRSQERKHYAATSQQNQYADNITETTKTQKPLSQYEPVGSLTKKVNSFAIRQKRLQNEDSTDQEAEIVETQLGYEEDDEQEEEDDLMEFPSQKIQLIQEIGQGTYGKVYKALATGILFEDKETPVVVKQCYQNASEEELEIFLQPAEAMRHLNHENILSLLGVSIDGSNMMIIMEDCMNGNLKNYLKKNRPHFSVWKRDGTLIQMICDMANGLLYLHTMEIFHNDFAARNCQVSLDNCVKVGDYGLARTMFRGDYYARTPGQQAWPVRWMAPEIILDRENGVLDSLPETVESNVWSFGITLWEVCKACEQPYPNMTDEMVIELLDSSGVCNLKNPVPSPDPLSSLYRIMKQCWNAEQDRPSMREVTDQLSRLKDALNKNSVVLSEELSSELKLKQSASDKRKRRSESEEPLLLSQTSLQEETDQIVEVKSTVASKKVAEKQPTKQHTDKQDTKPVIKDIKDTKWAVQENTKTKRNETIEQTRPSKSKEQTKPSKKTEQTRPSKSKEQTKPSKKTEQTRPSKSKEQTKPSKKTDQAKPNKTKEQLKLSYQEEKQDSDINDMDDIFYPPKSFPTSMVGDEDEWDEEETGFVPSKPSVPQPTTGSKRISKESWDSFDDTEEEGEFAPPPDHSVPPLTTDSRRFSKESWDSFDEEETDFQNETPPPPTEFSQDENYDEDDYKDTPLDMLPTAQDDNLKNDWEEFDPANSEPVTPVKLDIPDMKNKTVTKLEDSKKKVHPPQKVSHKESEKISTQGHKPTPYDSGAHDDDTNTEPVEPVKLDLLANDEHKAQIDEESDYDDKATEPIQPVKLDLPSYSAKEKEKTSKGKTKGAKTEKEKAKKKENEKDKKKEKDKKRNSKSSETVEEDSALFW